MEVFEIIFFSLSILKFNDNVFCLYFQWLCPSAILKTTLILILEKYSHFSDNFLFPFSFISYFSNIGSNELFSLFPYYFYFTFPFHLFVLLYHELYLPKLLLICTIAISKVQKLVVILQVFHSDGTLHSFMDAMLLLFLW